MSAALYLKQSIYQLSSEKLIDTLNKYYSSNSQDFSVNTSQKAYKCYECCILVQNAKYCAGFGRNEEEASLNAGRIALESIIDSGETANLKKILEGTGKSDLENVLDSVGGLEFAEVFYKEKIKYEDLSKLNIESLKVLVPLSIAIKLHSHFHPAEVSQVIAENEVRCI
jgi:hypothetical protein